MRAPKLTAALGLGLGLGLGLQVAARPASVIVDQLDQVPPEWQDIGSPDPSQLFKFAVGIRPANAELLHDTIAAISDPSSDQYGKHLSRHHALQLVAPSLASSEAVRRWLLDAGVIGSHISDSNSLIHFFANVSQAEDLMGSDYRVYARGTEEVVRTLEYSVPLAVREHITMIQPTTVFGSTTVQGSTIYPKFPFSKSKSARSAEPECDEPNLQVQPSAPNPKCDGTNTPECLRELYKMPPSPATPHKKSKFGIVGFNEQTAQYKELGLFIDRWAPYAKGANFTVEGINNGSNPQGEYPSGEANMNIQYAIAMSYNIPVRFYPTGGEFHDFIPDLDLNDPEVAYVEPFLDFASYMINLTDDRLPQVISMSYGTNEQLLPKAYATQVCDMFGVLGTRGVSIIVSGGNFGPGVSCQSNDGKKTTKFMPGFPSTCPYVTSVGGTQGLNPETAIEFSSGGFSDYFARPKYQDDVIPKFLKNLGSKWQGYFNPKGRAWPDVAAQAAVTFPMYNHGEVEQGGGTSAAAPLFASMIALINNDRFHKNKPSLGFLNPLIYKYGSTVFTDITEGRSVGCEGTSLWGVPSPIIPDAGWNATQGWDPITGFGTPRFDRLKKLCLSL